MSFEELERVRVVKLLSTERDVLGSFNPSPQPLVGEVGMIVDVRDDAYTVECVDGEGYTRWLADFAAEELEATQ
jgi:hypothetical protein